MGDLKKNETLKVF